MRRRTNRNAAARFALYPLAMTTVLTLSIAVLAVWGADGPALCLGVGAGAGCFLQGAIVGGRLGNAREIGQARADVFLRLGACLALAGIAAGAQGHDPPFREVQRVLIGLGQAAASILAVGLAARSMKQARTAKETEGRDEIAAKPL